MIFYDFRCTLCGKVTPTGTSNVLLHFRHHHIREYNKIKHLEAPGVKEAAKSSLDHSLHEAESEEVQVKVEIVDEDI